MLRDQCGAAAAGVGAADAGGEAGAGDGTPSAGVGVDTCDGRAEGWRPAVAGLPQPNRATSPAPTTATRHARVN